MSSSYVGLLLLFSITSSFYAVIGVKKVCDVHSSFWCDTNETESLCDAQSPCTKYNSTVWNRKLNLTLLYQPLCIHSKIIITKMLIPEIQAHMSDIINIELIPYGNSIENGSMNFVCQYGKIHCRLIRFHACILHFLPKVSDHLGLIGCLESHDGPKAIDYIGGCLAEWGLSKELKEKIQKCEEGELSNELLHKMELRVDDFWPTEHQWVPWLLINNVSTTHIQSTAKTLSKSLCNMYRGSKLPNSCAYFMDRLPTHDL